MRRARRVWKGDAEDVEVEVGLVADWRREERSEDMER